MVVLTVGNAYLLCIADAARIAAVNAELATLSAECAQASQPRMAEAALRLLAAASFYPGFKEEPGWLACLEDAMRLVNQDAAATGIRHPCQLRVHDDDGLNWSVNAHVETWDGYTGIAQGIYPASGADPVSALVAAVEPQHKRQWHCGLPERATRYS